MPAARASYPLSMGIREDKWRFRLLLLSWLAVLGLKFEASAQTVAGASGQAQPGIFSAAPAVPIDLGASQPLSGAAALQWDVNSSLFRTTPQIGPQDATPQQIEASVQQLVDTFQALRSVKRPEAIAALEELKARINESIPLVQRIAPKKAQALLDARLDVSAKLSDLRLERAMKSLGQVRKAWARGAEPGQAALAVDAIAGEVSAAPDPKIFFDSFLAGQAKAFEAAKASPKLGWLQRPVVRHFLGRRIERMQSQRRELAGTSDGVEFALSHLTAGTPLTTQDRAIMEGLRDYVPGLNPDMAVTNQTIFDYYTPGGRAAGWAVALSLGQDGRKSEKSFITVGANQGDELYRLHTIIHEGFHQGDENYAKGRTALQLLVGNQDAGAELWRIVIEGFTEWRTRQTMLKILEDGYAVKSPFSQGVWSLAKRRLQADDPEDAGNILRDHFKNHAYTPFVELAELMARELGGMEPIERFVAHGDIVLLAARLGPRRLQLLARLSHLGQQYDNEGEFPLPQKARIASEAGIADWLVTHMKDVVSGRLVDPAYVKRIAWRIKTFVREVEIILNNTAPKRKMIALRVALAGLDLNDRLGSDRPKKELPRVSRRSILSLFDYWVEDHFPSLGHFLSTLAEAAAFPWMVISALTNPKLHAMMPTMIFSPTQAILLAALQTFVYYFLWVKALRILRAKHRWMSFLLKYF